MPLIFFPREGYIPKILAKTLDPQQPNDLSACEPSSHFGSFPALHSVAVAGSPGRWSPSLSTWFKTANPHIVYQDRFLRQSLLLVTYLFLLSTINSSKAKKINKGSVGRGAWTTPSNLSSISGSQREEGEKELPRINYLTSDLHTCAELYEHLHGHVCTLICVCMCMCVHTHTGLESSVVESVLSTQGPGFGTQHQISKYAFHASVHAYSPALNDIGTGWSLSWLMIAGTGWFPV